MTIGALLYETACFLKCSNSLNPSESGKSPCSHPAITHPGIDARCSQA
jgi:hypothetical protein